VIAAQLTPRTAATWVVYASAILVLLYFFYTPVIYIVLSLFSYTAARGMPVHVCGYSS